MEYQPKGSMCNICKSKYNDCSSLEFRFMNVIEKPNIVKCTFFEKQKKVSVEDEKKVTTEEIADFINLNLEKITLDPKSKIDKKIIELGVEEYKKQTTMLLART